MSTAPLARQSSWPRQRSATTPDWSGPQRGDVPGYSAMAERVVLIRHGETEWSASGRHTGRTDIPLTDTGRRQADLLGQAVAGETFSAVFTSPLVRACETIRRGGLGDAAVELDQLMEWDYGVYEGRRTVDIRQEIPTWSVWTHSIHGGESLDHVAERVDAVIARLDGIDGTVAISAHGHLLRILASRWLGLPPVVGSRLALETATVSELGWERENRAIHRWNQGCHLQPIEEQI